MTKDTFYLHIKNAKDLKLISRVSREKRRKRKRRRENTVYIPNQEQSNSYSQIAQQTYFNPFPSNSFTNTTNLQTENLRLQNRDMEVRQQIKVEPKPEIKEEPIFKSEIFEKGTALSFQKPKSKPPLTVRFDGVDEEDNIDVVTSYGSDSADFSVSPIKFDFEDSGDNTPFTPSRTDYDSNELSPISERTTAKATRKPRQKKDVYDEKKMELKELLKDAGVAQEKYEHLTTLTQLTSLLNRTIKEQGKSKPK